MTLAAPPARQTGKAELRREPFAERSGSLNPPVELRLIETETMETDGLLLEFDVLFWNTIKNSTEAEDYEAYLQIIPEGVFASLARRRVMRLGAMAEGGEMSPKPVGRSHGLDFDRLNERAKENTERMMRKAAGFTGTGDGI